MMRKRINSFKASFSSRQVRWDAKPHIRTTDNLRKLNKAVYCDKEWQTQLHATYNDHLTEEQCLYLYLKVEEREQHVWRGILVQRANFPLDLARKIVLKDEHRFMLQIMANHPKLDIETRATAALRLMSTTPTRADAIIDFRHLLDGGKLLMAPASDMTKSTIHRALHELV